MTAKFGADRKVFLHALEKVSKVLPTSNAAPLLLNFLVEAREDGSIRISATDKSVTLVTTLSEGVVVATPGKLLLPSKATLEIIHKSEGASFLVMTHPDIPDMVVLGCGPTKWQLKTRNVEIYPEVAELVESEVHTLNRQNFLTALNSVRKAMATKFKPNFTQIGVRGGKVTAADGVWFQECALPEASNLDISIPHVVVPDLVSMLSSSDDEFMDVGLAAESDSMIFKVGREVMTTHAMVLPFPDLAKSFLIPAMSNNWSLKVPRKTLEASLRRVRITSDPNTMAVSMDLSLKDYQRMVVSARTKSGSTSEETIDVEWTGGDRRLVFHHEYLMKMLSSFDDETLEFKLGQDQTHKPSVVLVQSNGRSGVLNQLRADLV